MARKTEVQISYPPSDVISAVKFAPNNNQFLIVSSWDGLLRLYDVINNSLRQKYHHNCPVLDVCFQVRSINIVIKIFRLILLLLYFRIPFTLLAVELTIN